MSTVTKGLAKHETELCVDVFPRIALFLSLYVGINVGLFPRYISYQVNRY